MNSKISILIPAYNTGRYIAECIESVIAQTYRNLEIIIVDDGSTDNTKAIAERYALNDSRINVVAISHEGVSTARNVCMSHATGDYILFVDSDDWIGDNLCRELIDLATQNCADIVFSAMTVMPEEGNPYLFGDRSGLFKDAEVLNGKDCFIRMVDTGCTYPMVAGNLYRRSIIVSNKLSFHGKYHEDEYFMPIVVNVAKRVCLSQQSEYYYRYRHGSIMHSKTNIRDRSIVLGEIADLIMDNISLSNQTPTYNRALYQHISTLRQRSRRLYDSYLPDSDKPVLIVFLEKGISSQYGIGTYVGFLSDVMSGESWDVILVEINAYDKSMPDFSIRHSLPCYSFPRFDTTKDSSHEGYKSYYTGIFYYLATRIGFGKKVLCHFNNFNQESLAMSFKEKFASRIVFTVHYTDWGFRLHGDQHEINRILSNPRNNYEKSVRDNFNTERDFLANCCDCVIAISGYSYSYLHRLYELPESKLRLVHNCVRVPRFTSNQITEIRKKYGFKDCDKIILYVGRIDEGKGIYELIGGFKKVLSEESNARLVIAGDGAFSLALKKACPNWMQMCFTGFVTQATLYDLYAISDIGVVPSFHEEFGYVAVEMASAKLPVLVNPIGGLKEIAADIDGVHAMEDDCEKPLSERIANGIISTVSKAQECSPIIPRKYLFEEFKERMITLYHNVWDGHG